LASLRIRSTKPGSNPPVHGRREIVKIRCGARVAGLIALFLLGATVARAADDAQVQRGRYLALIAGCNDCHTAGFMEKTMAVPEQEWLKGSPVGFQGPWGTTYAANLRLVLEGLTEAQWLEYAKIQRLPPMPSYALQQMSADDLKAIYAYVRSLGEPGQPAPAYVPPGGKVATPYVMMLPRVDAPTASGGK
jgi:mono/diheme cytochrome c family protein